VSVSIAKVHSVRHISILSIRVVTIMEVLCSQSVILLHLHTCLPARVVLCVDGWMQVGGEGDDVESEDERYGPFQHGCSVANILEVAYGKCCYMLAMNCNRNRKCC
jgi:hypothetical protein